MTRKSHRSVQLSVQADCVGRLSPQILFYFMKLAAEISQRRVAVLAILCRQLILAVFSEYVDSK